MKYFKKDPITKKPVMDRALLDTHIIDPQAKKDKKIGRLFTGQSSSQKSPIKQTTTQKNESI